MAEKALTFEELAGELRELASRVVALDIRDQSAAVVLQGEGQFGDSEDDPGSWSFQVGGYAPPERDGIRFIVASWLTVCIDKEHVAEAHDISTGIGVADHDSSQDDKGRLTVTVWPAMPAEQTVD